MVAIFLYNFSSGLNLKYRFAASLGNLPLLTTEYIDIGLKWGTLFFSTI